MPNTSQLPSDRWLSYNWVVVSMHTLVRIYGDKCLVRDAMINKMALDSYSLGFREQGMKNIYMAYRRLE